MPPSSKRPKIAFWPFPWALGAVGVVLLLQYLVHTAVNQLTLLLGLNPGPGFLLWCLPPLFCIALTLEATRRWRSLSLWESLRFLGVKALKGRSWVSGLLLSIPILEGYWLAARNYQSHGVPVSFFPVWPFLLVLFTVSAGLYEEIFFRGFLFQSLRTGRSFLSAASLSSLLWVLAHWSAAFTGPNVRYVFPAAITFLLGLAGAYVFERSGNAIWSWMIVHVVIDSIGLLNIGNTGLFRAPVGWPMAYVFIGELLCVILAFPLANGFWPARRK
jgi:membrane protease YdiL (CAAX protease family)